jgi:glutaredoxin 3
MARVKIFSTGICPICDNTKNLLNKWGIEFQEARVDLDRAELKEMLQVTDGARMVPQILIDGKWIGGFTDLTELHMEGKLEDLVANNA